jgi:amino acid adenylation domain-containing protein
LHAYQHQDYPFAGLLNDLNVRRDASRSPVIATTFNVDQPMAMPDMPGIELELYSQPISFTHFDLSLNIIESADELVVECDYNTDLFDAATITRLLGRLRVLLEGIVATEKSLDQKIADLPLLTGTERRQLLLEWNDTQAAYPRDKCIHHLFEAQVEQSPDAVAVTFKDQCLTYRELDTRANQLAHYLQSLGVGPKVLVGICVERSLEMVVGLLGVLKAGGAYVPLDPTYPRERRNFVLEDTRAPVLLTQEHLLAELAGHSARVICLDGGWETIAQGSKEKPVSSVSAANLVYVIYTSGSTGRPKGVPVTHRNLVHSTHAHIMHYAEPITSFLLLSSFAFDSSVPGIFWTLCQGGKLVLPLQDQQSDLAYISSLLDQHQVSHLISIPSFYNLILAHAEPRQLAKLKVAIVAGESCSRELVEQHHEQLAHTLLFNEYGPTEGTVWCSFYQCQALESSNVPIGRPIANATIYLLDAHQQPVPIGVPGELYIGGAGIARGYLNRPKLTAASFIPDPFGNEPGARLYKTGDLARYRPDGNIEFLGRIDYQVKVRGFRIEPGEIEAALGEHPALREVVVLARGAQNTSGDGDKQLVAFVTTAEEPAPSVSELRNFLRGKLPEYMIPSAFVTLETLPLTPGGKVDRRALPAPDGARPELEADFVMPQTEAERAIATLWRQALKVDKVGIHDNFFDLGGHSLMLVEVHTKLQETLERDLPIVEMFRYPTINMLAAYLAQKPDDRPFLQKSLDRANKQREAMKRQTQRMRAISRGR